eukprot:scaffold3121_cov211-Skeletonema_marinoi.AAC.3
MAISPLSCLIKMVSKLPTPNFLSVMMMPRPKPKSTTPPSAGVITSGYNRILVGHHWQHPQQEVPHWWYRKRALLALA